MDLSRLVTVLLQNVSIFVGNDKTFFNTVLLLGILWYVGVMSFAVLMHEHEHEHEHADPCHADEHCAACVYISQSVGIEVYVLPFVSPDFCM